MMQFYFLLIYKFDVKPVRINPDVPPKCPSESFSRLHHRKIKNLRNSVKKKNNNLHVTYFKHIEKEYLILKNLLKYPKNKKLDAKFNYRTEMLQVITFWRKILEVIRFSFGIDAARTCLSKNYQVTDLPSSCY